MSSFLLWQNSNGNKNLSTSIKDKTAGDFIALA